MLDEEVDSFKTLTALLLSSMKSFVTFRSAGQKGADEAQENRNYYVQAMVDSIDEIIRVLQLFEAHEDLIGNVVICYKHSLVVEYNNTILSRISVMIAIEYNLLCTCYY